MKQVRILFISIFFLLVITPFVISSSSYGANLTYTLLPGSTITPVYGPDPTGATEALTGTFQWYEVDSGSTNLRAFNASYLRFESSSYLITLNTTPLNDHASSVFTGNNVTFFLEEVDIVGLPISTGTMSTYGTGTYSGLSYSPEYLNYPDIRISPVSGGVYYAKLNLVAAIAPEPISSILFVTGGMLLAGRRYLKRKA